MLDRGKLLVLTLGLVCTACPNPNTFTTPRTVPAGKVQHTVSVEAIGAVDDDDSLVLPTLPSYTARIGLVEKLELGLHFSHLSSIGADLKWNAVRTPGFDLAIDPGTQVFYFVTGESSVVIYYLHLPLLLGFNLSNEVSLVLTPGVTMLGVGGTISDPEDDDFYGSSDSAWLARAGVGVDIRASEKFSVQPEFTLLTPFQGGGVVFLGGVGFKFGAQPEY